MMQTKKQIIKLAITMALEDKLKFEEAQELLQEMAEEYKKIIEETKVKK